MQWMSTKKVIYITVVVKIVLRIYWKILNWLIKMIKFFVCWKWFLRNSDTNFIEYFWFSKPMLEKSFRNSRFYCAQCIFFNWFLRCMLKNFILKGTSSVKKVIQKHGWLIGLSNLNGSKPWILLYFIRIRQKSFCTNWLEFEYIFSIKFKKM